MTARMSDKRRGAFLEALEACGNQTVAAERVCVSRSWVCQERMRNPEFDAECKRVIEAARARLRKAEGNRPPEGWGHLDGMELVVRGTKGRRVQIARARAGQWTAASEDRFLEVFAATCNAKAAYEAAGKSKGSAYSHRKRWPAFARRWDEAEGMSAIRLEYELVRRAGNPFSASDLPELVPIPAMSADDIMHNLNMHQYRTHGMGKPPGRAPRTDFEKACRSIERAIDAIERAAVLSDAEKAAERRSWERRRGPWAGPAAPDSPGAFGPDGRRGAGEPCGDEESLLREPAFSEMQAAPPVGERT